MRVSYFSILIIFLLFNNCLRSSKGKLESTLSDYIRNEMFLVPSFEEETLLKVKAYGKYSLIDTLSDLEKKKDAPESQAEKGKITFDLADLKSKSKKYSLIKENDVDSILQQNLDPDEVIIRIYKPFYHEEMITIDIDAYFNKKSGIMERLFIDSETFEIKSKEQRGIM